MNNTANNLILVGYKGAGKTSIGRALSQASEYQFLDTDECFQAIYKESVQQFFKRCGEAEFRKHEAKMIQELPQLPLRVIATGGGVVEEFKNILHLHTLGRIIYLQSDFSTIEHRLKQLGPIPDFVNLAHYTRRHHAYLKAAHEVISCEGKSIAAVVNLILGERHGE